MTSKIRGLLAVAILFAAIGALPAHDGHDDAFGTAQIVAELNKASAALQAGDTPGARATLKSLSKQLGEHPSPQNRAIRRKVLFIQVNLFVGNRRMAQDRLQSLIGELSQANPPGDDPPPPAADPAQPAPPTGSQPGAKPKAGTLDHSNRYYAGYRAGYYHGYRDGYYHSWNPYHDPRFWTWDRMYRQGYLDGYNSGYRAGWWHHNDPGHDWPW